MTWDRIEVMGRSLDLVEGVKARIADPFWMMGRQWQVGEFRGDDAGQPVAAQINAETVPLSGYRSDASGDVITGWPQMGDGTRPPLERLVEEIPTPESGFAGARRAAELGHDLRQRLLGARLESLANWLETECRFTDLPAELAATGRACAAMRLLQRRGVDARRVTGSRADDFNRQVNALRPDARNRATVIIADWTKAHGQPDANGWLPSRLEYRCTVAGLSHHDKELTLSLPEHTGGDLDWYQFEMGGTPLKLETKADLSGQLDDWTAIPTPVSFAGMPASRWWEVEDRAVHMGDINAGPGDFARLMVAEFATTYSDDWFVVPMRVQKGALVRVNSLKVFNNFDTDAVTVLPIGTVDRGPDPLKPRTRVFRLFEMDADPTAQLGAAPWLFVAPTLASSQTGPALEAVDFARDEGANLAWAVEDRVEGPMGRAVDRAREWFASRTEPQQNDASSEWRYRLAADVPPPWWIPFIPERIGDTTEMRLRRARMSQWAELGPGLAGPKSQVLAPQASQFYIEEEEIPRAGIRVERHYQLARAEDGSLHLWMRYAKTRGRQARASGLRWDIIER